MYHTILHGLKTVMKWPVHPLLTTVLIHTGMAPRPSGQETDCASLPMVSTISWLLYWMHTMHTSPYTSSWSSFRRRPTSQLKVLHDVVRSAVWWQFQTLVRSIHFIDSFSVFAWFLRQLFDVFFCFLGGWSRFFLPMSAILHKWRLCWRELPIHSPDSTNDPLSLRGVWARRMRNAHLSVAIRH